MDRSTPVFLFFVGMISAILWLWNDIDTLTDATLKPSYDYIVGMYVTLHRILKPSYDYTVGMYVTLHRILKPSGTCHSGCCELPFLSIIYTMDLTN
jgi:hypothetical protein